MLDVSEVKKIFESKVKSGEITFTGKEVQEAVHYGLGSSSGYRSERSISGEEATPEPYEVNNADHMAEYLYKGILSAKYSADEDFMWGVKVNSVDIGYTFYGIVQVEAEVGEIAITDPAKGIELYLTKLRKERQEAYDAQKAEELRQEQERESLLKQDNLLPLYNGGKADFFYNKETQQALSVEDGVSYEVQIATDNFVGFYVKRSCGDYRFHLFTPQVFPNNGKFKLMLSFEKFRIFLKEFVEEIPEIKKIDGVYTDGQVEIPKEATNAYLKYPEIVKENGCNCIINTGKYPRYGNYWVEGFSNVYIVHPAHELSIFDPEIKDGTLFLNVPSDIAGKIIGKQGKNIQELISDWNSRYSKQQITNVKVNAVAKASNEDILAKIRKYCNL